MIQQYMLQFYVKSTGNVPLAVQRGIFKYYIQWKPLIMITLGPTLFDKNNRLITLSENIKICII